MENKVYNKKGYTIKVAIIKDSKLKFLNKKIKEELFIRQKIGCEIESVSAITRIGDDLCCVITYKDFHKPNEFYSYYI